MPEVEQNEVTGSEELDDHPLDQSECAVPH